MNFEDYRDNLKLLVGDAPIKPFEEAAQDLLNELMFGKEKTVIVSMGTLAGKTTVMQLAGEKNINNLLNLLEK